MKAIIKNSKNPEMSLCCDIDISLTPEELIYELIKNHPNPEKLLGGANTQLLKNKAVLIEHVDFYLDAETKVASVDEEDSISDYILSQKELFDTIETPTFYVNTSYLPNPDYYPYGDCYESYRNSITNFCHTLIVYGKEFSFKPQYDEYDIDGAEFIISCKDNTTAYSYSVVLDCEGGCDVFLTLKFKYVSNLILDKAEMRWWKEAILYNRLEIENGTSVKIEDNYDYNGFRIILLKELHSYKDKAIDYLVELYDFEYTIEKIITNIKAFRGQGSN